VIPIAPKQSKEHLALRKCAPDAAIELALRRFLWEINAHWGLVSLPLICHNLQEMLGLIVNVWRLDLKQCGLEFWPKVLDWIQENEIQLAEKVGGHFAAGFSGQGTHPLMGDGVTRHSVYATLCNSHVNPAKQKTYRLLQAHLLFAKIAVMQQHTTMEEYESYTGRPAVLQKKAYPYSAAFAVRRISEGISLALLEALPVESPPLAFLDGLSRVVPSAKGDIQRYTRLVTFLDKAFGRTAQQKRRSHQRAGDSAKRRRVHGGRTDSWLPVQREDVAIDDPGDSKSHRQGHHSTTTRSRHKSSESDERLDVDDCPGEDEEDEEVDRTGFDDEAFQRDPGSFHEVSAAQAMQVQMANQLFPWAYGELCVSEIAPLVARCHQECAAPQTEKMAAESMPPAELEVLALAQVMLWTSSSIERAQSLKLLDSTTSGRYADLSLRLETEDGVARWRIRSPLPQYRRPQPPAPERKNRTQVEFLELPDVADGSFLVRKLLKSRAGTPVSKAAEESQQPSSSKSRARVFPHKTAWYRKRLQRLLQTLDPGTRVTESRLSKFLFTRILRASGGDLTAAAITTGNDLRLAKVKLFYACPLVSRLQTFYVQVADSVNQELWRTIQKEPPKSVHIDVDNRNIYIGSRLCPTRDAVRQAIRRLQCELQRSPAILGLQRYHNLFTLYTLWMFFYTTGVRGVRAPYVDLSEIDPVFGLGILTDKDSGVGYKTRLARFTPMLIEQMRFYKNFISRSPLSYRLPDSPCFLLQSNLNPVEVRPRTLAPLLKEFLPFPVNIHRRFVSSELLDAGCPPEMVSAWMGHWYRGEEPWGKFSSFSYGDYCRALEDFLDPLLDDLGFRAIKDGASTKPRGMR
jgi:hypothetical protein